LLADTNSELDVLLIVLEGSGVATVDEQEHALVPGNALVGMRWEPPETTIAAERRC
jgi:quercetin dioxygenase-like cupin family protein